MTTAGELSRAACAALAYAQAQPGVREVEVFVAANASLLARLNYTSHIPCHGVEEPKSAESRGIGIQAVFESPEGPRLGFGSEPADLGERGAERAFAKARAAAVRDPEFVSLPRPRPEPRTLADYHDPRLMALDDASLVEAGWKIVGGGLRTFLASSRLAALGGGDAGLRALGLILGGDVTVLQERIAIVSTHLPEVQTDESTLMPAFVTAMVEAGDAKGSGWSTGTRLDHFTDEAGVEAAQHAVGALDGVRVPSGEYTVIFGKQPVADLLNNLVVPSLAASAFYASSTPFLGQLGRRVAHAALTIYDHGAMPGFMGSKGITCEGLATGRTDLIRDGA
ncbi:MAG: metallopeptidase TldD-related protein, partial [Candidatus Rokuibacteriota bacterium]